MNICTFEILLKTLRSKQNSHHFADGIFKVIFLCRYCCILIKISLKCVSKSGEHKAISGSDNGSAPLKRKTIIWVNDDLGYWPIYRSLGLDELNVTSYRKPS